MNVVNTHKRIINQSYKEIYVLLATLSTKADKVWPKDKWPAIRFKNGLKVGEIGGHGMIRYSVEAYTPGVLIVFRFLKPIGFKGIHKFEIKEINATSTEITHSVIMNTAGFKATIQWCIAIRWMHDALIENAFDTIENNFLEVKKHTKWNYWVRFWRFILK